MWFLYGLIAFLIVIFSTSQIISYIICFIRYPELMKDMPSKNKDLILGGLILHICINVIWIILVCVIPSISQHSTTIIIVTILSLIFSISGIKNDSTLYSSFKTLTGADTRERNQINLNNLIEKLQQTFEQNNNKIDTEIDFVEDNQKLNDREYFENDLEDDEDKSNYNKDEDQTQSNRLLPLSNVKQKYLESRFRQSFENVIDIQKIIINNENITIYSFSSNSVLYGVIGGFLHLAEIGNDNLRYFALENSYDRSFVICEWKFDDDYSSYHAHINYGDLCESQLETLNRESMRQKFIERITEIIETQDFNE